MKYEIKYNIKCNLRPGSLLKLTVLLLAIFFCSPVYGKDDAQEKYTISGTISIKAEDGAEGLGGVTMMVNNGAESTKTDSSGHYSLEVKSGWTGTVTPTKKGYAFFPTEQGYPAVDKNYEEQNYTAMKSNDWTTLSGTVAFPDGTGLPEVRLEFYDIFGGISLGVTGSGGNYSKAIPLGWVGWVTAVKDGYAFETPKIKYDDAVDRGKNLDFIASETDLVIRGRVTTEGGMALPDTRLVFSNGTDNMETMTDFNGYYSLGVTHGWSGTVTPEKTGFTFKPGSIVYENIAPGHRDDQFTAVAAGSGSVITGRITDPQNQGVAGAWVEFPGDGQTRQTRTDADGNYVGAVPGGWSGSIWPRKEGYEFFPSDRGGRDFTAIPHYPVIRGKINTPYGTTAGIRLNFSGKGGHETYTYTGTNGTYNHAIPPDWSGTVTPHKNGYVFWPESRRDYENVVKDVENQDYDGENLLPVISGTVSVATDSVPGPLAGVTVKLSGGGPSVITDETGSFSISAAFGWSGAMTLEKDGYVFLPCSQEYKGLHRDQRGQDFLAVPGTVSMTLDAAAQSTRTLIIKKRYVDLKVTVNWDLVGIDAVIIARKEGSGNYIPTKEFRADDLEKGGTLVYKDKDIPTNNPVGSESLTYTYKAWALHDGGLKVRETEEKVVTF